MIIRPAHILDVDALVALNSVVQSIHASLDPTLFKPAADQEAVAALFTEAIGSKNAYILVAERDSEPVGYVWMELQERPDTPFSPRRCRSYIHHLAVREETQRNGVASALMREVEKKSRAAGIDRIVLDAWATNRVAQHYFKAHGFTPLSVVLSKTLT